ncbi:MAG: bifunctional serine/threonine-protein kinase/formylglycine-generating enzyme family protein [Myxococcota bacterium]
MAPTKPDNARIGRYEVLRKIATGGMAELFVAKHVGMDGFEKVVALKRILSHLAFDEEFIAMFRDEARLVAKLNHPHIVQIYDLGKSDDSYFIAMEYIAGRNLSSIAKKARTRGESLPPVNIARCLAQACEGLYYAHTRKDAEGRGLEIIHRDVSPQNIIVSFSGSVKLVDFGIAKAASKVAHTRTGVLKGKYAYMSPEQLSAAPLSAASDVFALGAMLYEILSGIPPFPVALPARRAARTATPAPLPETVPEELAEICTWALSASPSARPQDGAALGAAVGDWLAGTLQRVRALAVVERALALRPQIIALQDDARTAARLAQRLLHAIPPFAAVDVKRPGWESADRATALQQQVEGLQQQQIELLQAAFTHHPGLPEAHAALADHYRDRHERAEEDGLDEARRLEGLLRHHDRGGRHQAYLSGAARLTLDTDVPGAQVTLYRYHEHDRRLQARQVEVLGQTPLRESRVMHGRCLLVIEAAQRLPVRIPLFLRRQEQWSTSTVCLPHRGALAQGERFIAGGAGWLGGDPEAHSGLPRRQVHIDSFVIQRQPVTNQQYLRFLSALMAAGREADALRFAPQERSSRQGEPGALLYGIDADGGFFLKPDAEGHLWRPDWPVMCIDWFSACAYADWWAEQTGQPWRLPTEAEWERAAGGGDRRIYPWGDVLDPTFCCMRRSHRGVPMPAAVDDYPLDESPYGVLGMAGNVRDWCLDLFDPDGDATAPEDPDDRAVQRSVRGGSWFFFENSARVASRFGFGQGNRSDNVGFRLVRSVANAASGSHPEV